MTESDPLAPKDAAPATAAANAKVLGELPFADRRDFEDARRGFIAALPEGRVRVPGGGIYWDLRPYKFLDEETAPATVNPSLWRQARLNMANGLFKVVEGVYQVRGYDIANMTVVEGRAGLIVIDALTTAEVSRAGLELYFAHRPKRPIAAMIYTHSHLDHYGGVLGVVDPAEVAAGRTQVIAPDRFLEAVAGENVLAGVAMRRRALFQFGPLLPPGPRGQVDAGLGKGIARGSAGLVAPTLDIAAPFETHVVDGVTIEFQLAPESEAPAEMHLFLPEFGVLNLAENACRNLHNFLPLRGSAVRDPRLWSHYLAEAMDRYGPRADVLAIQHHWPVWGKDAIRAYLERQRDLYKHIHDQTVRLMNLGCPPSEIAERVRLPAELGQAWAVRGYYGTTSHNAKAVYQRYLGWYDGNPANLNPLPPRAQARKTVEYMGGAPAMLARARADFGRGEFRWVAEVMNRLVFAEPDNRAARELAADACEQLGYQAESATWRNAYLFAARELRQGMMQLPPRPMLSPDLLQAVTVSTLIDFVAVRLNPEKVAGRSFEIGLEVGGERAHLTLKHETLTHRMGKAAPEGICRAKMSRETLVELILGRVAVEAAIAAGKLYVAGDAAPLAALFAMLDDFPMMFELVAPRPDGL